MRKILAIVILTAISFAGVAQKIIYTKVFTVDCENERYKGLIAPAEAIIQSSRTARVVVLGASEFASLKEAKKSDSTSVFVPRVVLGVSFYYSLNFFGEGDGGTLLTVHEFKLDYFPAEISKKFVILQSKFPN